MKTTNGNKAAKGPVESPVDGRLKLLEQLRANAELTRCSRKTDPETVKFASDLEAEFAKRIQELQAA